PRIRVPIAPLYPLAVGAEAWARFTGREPFLTRDGLRMARHHMFFNDAKARQGLGYSSRPYREGLADAITWFPPAGYLRQRAASRRRGSHFATSPNLRSASRF